MPLLRKLPPLDEAVSPLVLPRTPRPNPNQEKRLIPTPLPTHAAVKFLNECNELDSTKNKKRYKFFLSETHLKTFGVYPEAGTPLEVVKARCGYRLQYEGHRVTKTQPSSKFMQNYRALMAFRGEDHFKGCTEEVYSLGNRLTDVSKGEISMTTNKTVEREAKKEAKAKARIEKAEAKKKAKIVKAKKPGYKGPKGGKRILVLGEYPVTRIIPWYGREGCTAKQIEEALKRLGVKTTPIMVAAYKSTVRLIPARMPEEHKKKLLYVVPKAEAVAAKPAKATPKKAKAPAAKKATPPRTGIIKKAAAPAAAK